MSLSEAASRSGTTVSSIRRLLPSAVALRKGTWRVTPYDAEPRRMRFLGPRGYESVLTHDSRDASEIAHYLNAIREFRTSGSTRALKEFEDSYIEIDGKQYDFVTDPKTINRLVRSGEISVLDIYDDEDL